MRISTASSFAFSAGRSVPPQTMLTPSRSRSVTSVAVGARTDTSSGPDSAAVPGPPPPPRTPPGCRAARPAAPARRAGPGWPCPAAARTPLHGDPVLVDQLVSLAGRYGQGRHPLGDRDQYPVRPVPADLCRLDLAEPLDPVGHRGAVDPDQRQPGRDVGRAAHLGRGHQVRAGHLDAAHHEEPRFEQRPRHPGHDRDRHQREEHRPPRPMPRGGGPRRLAAGGRSRSPRGRRSSGRPAVIRLARRGRAARPGPARPAW